MSSTSAVVLKPEELTPYKLWQTEIDAAEKEMKDFYRRGDECNKKFLDERDATFADNKWFNIYYANTNILESALYAQIPKPDVRRKYTDYQDQVARVGSNILQRCLEQDLNDPIDQFDSVMRQAVQDRLIPGLGTAWLRLETDTEDIPESEGGTTTNNVSSIAPEPKGGADGFTVQNGDQGQLLVPMKRIVEQRVVIDYVFWKDLIWSPCRVWSERRWTGRKTYLNRKQLETRFGEKGKLCQLNYNARSTSAANQGGEDTTPKNVVYQMAVVYEIWDRISRKVIWWSAGLPEQLLDERDDFLGLMDFEPCPQPMLANITTSNTTPRPDYYMIQDQYRELDLVNQRIDLLVNACKVVGVYNGSAKAIQDMLKGNENTMIPVENWAQFSEKGGVDGNIDWLPLDQVVAALQELNDARERIKGQIYELTGIADIVRGASKASETLGAQQIKAQFASIRIQKLQAEVARFASDILRIKAEIMVKHFTPEMLINKSGIMNTDDADTVPEAIALIKSELGFKWRVKVQADSMAQADYASEKQDRIEFMSAVTGYLAQALPMATQVPEMKPVILGLLKWGIAGFKKGSDIEGMIDKQLSALEGKPPAPPPPDPKVQAMQMKAQTDQQKAQADMARDQQKAQLDQQQQEQEIAFRREEMALEQQGRQMELQFKERELELKAREGQQNLEATIQKNQVDMATHQQKAQLDVQNSMVQNEQQRIQGEQQIELAERQGEQQLEQGAAAGKQKLALDKQAAAQKAKQQPKGKNNG